MRVERRQLRASELEALTSRRSVVRRVSERSEKSRCRDNLLPSKNFKSNSYLEDRQSREERSA